VNLNIKIIKEKGKIERTKATIKKRGFGGGGGRRAPGDEDDEEPLTASIKRRPDKAQLRFFSFSCEASVGRRQVLLGKLWLIGRR
jgi:hypothetical protein